jgi:membrane-bound lytic murein transglycosylase MltF
MYKNATSIHGSVAPILLLFVLLLPMICCKKEPPVAPVEVKELRTASAQVAKETPSAPTPSIPKVSPDDPPPPSNSVRLPINVERHTGDLDEIVKRGDVRALVILNPVGFFYESGVPRGVMYESLRDFQSFINEKLKTGANKVEVSFLPVRIDQLEAALMEGMGDIIAYAVTITSERARRVAFSTPIKKGVSQIIVTGPKYGAVSTFEGLAGKEVYVNPLTVYYDNLQKVNDSLRNSGNAPIVIKAADTNLTNDDLIQMVNAGLIPATVTTGMRADLWSKILDNIKPNPELVIASGAEFAWVMRKNNPRLKQVVDEFVDSHAAGTSFGNTLIRRYLKNADWVKDSTSKKQMEKYHALKAIFQKYAGQYDFDFLLLAAQGYQESGLNQAMKSPGGAVGIMQVIPKDAAASPINIPEVSDAAGNIHAAAKMLRNIADKYFNDPEIDPFNRALFVLASYNAGPNRIAGLREQAKEQGLDPNVWFDNVELVVAKNIGQVTVMYVRNIYKYYVAYKLALEQ